MIAEVGDKVHPRKSGCICFTYIKSHVPTVNRLLLVVGTSRETFDCRC